MILIDKPENMTSFGVVARVRRKLSEKARKKVKVGHTGTLDPFATGLMILLVGKACKQAAKFSKLDKTYEAVVILGSTSTTGDPEGEIKKISVSIPNKNEVQAALSQFLGEITQIPPAFSAIKVDGKRAYKLAREGKEVKIPERKVIIHELELIEYTYPKLKIRARVSSGTYIRTLAEDIGKALKTGAYCHQLRRTVVGEWGIKQATKLEEFKA